jgi:AraC family transcriptional regulator
MAEPTIGGHYDAQIERPEQLASTRDPKRRGSQWRMESPMLCYAQLNRTAPRELSSPSWIVKQTTAASKPTERSLGAIGRANGVRRSNAPDTDDGIPVAASTANASKARNAELNLLEDLRRLIVADPVSARATALRLASLLSAPSTGDAASARGGLAPWQQRKLDQYLKENLARPVRLRLLAELVNLSVSHFNRSFKASRGIAPHRHIVQLRLERAQSLMRSTNDPLCDIALACGLTDQAHLTKLFRRHLGQTPNAWRRKFFSEEAPRQSADSFAGSVHSVQSKRVRPVFQRIGCE